MEERKATVPDRKTVVVSRSTSYVSPTVMK